jgi:hypothetical protein
VAYGSDTIELPAHSSTQHSREPQGASSTEASQQQQGDAIRNVQPHQQDVAGTHKKKKQSSQQQRWRQYGSTSSSQSEAPLQYPGMFILSEVHCCVACSCEASLITMGQ